jgi:hypothetical protein
MVGAVGQEEGRAAAVPCYSIPQSNGIIVGSVIGSSEYEKGTPASRLPCLLDVILIEKWNYRIIR